MEIYLSTFPILESKLTGLHGYGYATCGLTRQIYHCGLARYNMLHNNAGVFITKPHLNINIPCKSVVSKTQQTFSSGCGYTGKDYILGLISMSLFVYYFIIIKAIDI